MSRAGCESQTSRMLLASGCFPSTRVQSRSNSCCRRLTVVASPCKKGDVEVEVVVVDSMAEGTIFVFVASPFLSWRRLCNVVHKVGKSTVAKRHAFCWRETAAMREDQAKSVLPEEGESELLPLCFSSPGNRVMSSFQSKGKDEDKEETAVAEAPMPQKSLAEKDKTCSGCAPGG